MVEFNKSGYPRSHTRPIVHIIRAIVFLIFISIPIMGAINWVQYLLHSFD